MKKASTGGLSVGGFLMAGFLAVVLTAPGNARAQERSPARPDVVYVSDFAIDSGDITTQGRPVMKRLQNMRQDPDAKADKLVEILAETLTSELGKKSVPARRLSSDPAGLNHGWLVQGEFVEVDEGNRMRRAMVGFGAGRTEMQVEVRVVDLGSPDRRPFLVFGTQSQSGKGPGAVVTLNPYVAAAKFVLSKRASDKDVRKTAGQIADVITRYINDLPAR